MELKGHQTDGRKTAKVGQEDLLVFFSWMCLWLGISEFTSAEIVDGDDHEQACLAISAT